MSKHFNTALKHLSVLKKAPKDSKEYLDALKVAGFDPHVVVEHALKEVQDKPEKASPPKPHTPVPPDTLFIPKIGD